MMSCNKFAFCFVISTIVLSVQSKDDDIKLLKKMMLEQQQKMSEQQQIVSEQQQRIEYLEHRLNDDNRSRKLRSVDVMDTDAPGLRRATQESSIAFSTRLTNRVTSLGHHQTIIYDHVITNVGNGYSNTDGIFVAPTSGLYVFAWSIAAPGGYVESSELVKNGIPYAYAYCDSESGRDYSVASNVVVLEAQRGEHVLVRRGTTGDDVVDGNNRAMFSGWLIYETQ